jgi:hypothetical protein
MRIRASFAAHALVVYAAALLFVAESPATLVAQQPPPPWTGVILNEASGESWRGGYAEAHSLSADGTFVVFTSPIPLLPNDTNGAYDIYVRNRLNGALSRVSVASDGTQGNGMSHRATISDDGRHVAFFSCASNLDPADTNSTCDYFVHDRQLATTALVSIGPNGERVPNLAPTQSMQLSADGRYVVFASRFPGYILSAWFRDRDADGDGVYDEPAQSTTTRISVAQTDSESLGEVTDVAISSDGGMVAYTAFAEDFVSEFTGVRAFLYDRLNATTVRIDRQASGESDAYSTSLGPDFADTGEVVFASDHPSLVTGDGDTAFDVFVYNVTSTTTTRLQLSHSGAPAAFTWMYYPTISADGRYVAFSGQNGEPGSEVWNVFAIDRQTSQSYDVSVRWDGTRDNEAYYSSISADGSAIAFGAGYYFLANPDGLGVYVATALSLSPLEVTVPTQTTSSVSVDVSVPADTRWRGRLIRFDPDQNSMVLGDEYEGIGPSTVAVEIAGPMGYEEEDWHFAVGTKTTLIHRRLIPRIQNVDPYYVSPAGGSVFTVNGDGFAQGATVLVDGVPATNIVVDEYGYSITATAPAHEETFDFVPVTVTNPNGHSGTEDYGVIYYAFDETPPVLESNVSGTQGDNGWWRSNVFVGWTLNDPESELFDITCPNVEVTEDTDSTIATCAASSNGGTSSIQVEIKRDATAPSASIVTPEARVYEAGQEVQIDVACADAMSGIASCAPSQGQHGGMLDTTTPGTFSFSVTATDNAGNTTTTSVSYTVKAVVAMTMSQATATYGGGPIALTASLIAGGNGVAGKTVRFYLDHVMVDIATTSASGIATSMLISIDDRDAGDYVLRADFQEDETAFSATDSNTLVIGKATPTLTWTNPGPIAYGTALSATQLNASASVAGAFAYIPAVGTVLPAGTHSLSASFTPADQTNYNSGSTSASLTVSKADPLLTWNNPSAIAYGTALSATQLNASANVAGSFAYSPAAGTVLGAGTHALGTTFTPTDTANYNSASTSVSITVSKADPILTWNNPAAIVYGTALSATQLNASANVGGSFAYSPAAGTVLGAGTQALGTTFTPTDTANYNSVPGSASITVTPKGLSIQTSNASKVYGQALPAFTVSGTGFVNGDTVASLSGTASFSTSATATSAPGSYTVTPSGLSSPNYTITFVDGTLTITNASTSVALSTSPNPSTQTQNVVITAVVSAVAPGAGTATGTIEFRDNGVLLGTATLVNGTATMTKKFKKGTHPLTAVYSGNTNFNGSTGASSHLVP